MATSWFLENHPEWFTANSPVLVAQGDQLPPQTAVAGPIPAEARSGEGYTPASNDWFQHNAPERFARSFNSAVGIPESVQDKPSEALEGLKLAVTHPSLLASSLGEMGKGAWQAMSDTGQKAIDAWKAGHPLDAAGYAIESGIPIVGPMLAHSGEQVSSGDVAGGLGTLTGIAGPMLAGNPAVRTAAMDAAKAGTSAIAREAVKNPLVREAINATSPGIIEGMGDTLRDSPKNTPGNPQWYTKQQMIDAGADGHLSRAIRADIPIEKIDGREPTPAMEGGYKKGTPITQPIEVQYDKANDKYMLYAGNHRVTQAEVNGQGTIPAFVENPPRELLKGAGDKSTQPTQTPAGAKPIDRESILSAINAADDSNEPFGYYGLRVMTDASSELKKSSLKPSPKVGDILPDSYRWEDNYPTDERLDGTSTVEIKEATPEAIDKAIKKLKPYLGEHVVLVGSDRVLYGDDASETLLQNPKVLAVYGREGKPSSDSLPLSAKGGDWFQENKP